MRRFSLAWVLMVLSAASLATDIGSGSYRCASYNVSGGGGSCRNMPPLVLNPDGSYRYSSTQGRWDTQDGKLHLSESELWGTGEILGKDSVRFEYDYKGWHHTVTWTCQECVYGQTAPASASTAATQGGRRGVSLTLEFGQNIGGVSGFVIVPAESASNYTHNAPLPQGAVQGLAWESDKTSADLSTNVYNKLQSGRQYVVFLAWPRETLPVALLDLPPGNTDYSATLPASLSYQTPSPNAGKTNSTDRSTSAVSQGSPLEDLAQALQELGTALKDANYKEKVQPSETTDLVAPRYQIGIQIIAIDEETARKLGRSSLRGIGVVRVLEDGRAEQAGLRAGDVLVAVNGIPVPSTEDYQRAMRHRESGESSLFTVFREGKYLGVAVP